MSPQHRGIASRLAAPVGRFGAAARRSAELAAERLAAPAANRSWAPLPEDRFTVVVHFAGDPTSAYQLEQWLWPLEQLSERFPLGILCRSALTAQRIAGRTGLPVRFGRNISDLDAVLGADSVRCVLYVNQATQNFHALRHARPAHVHLSHGESEKASMVTNQLKAYDRVLTSGQAARTRLSSQLISFGEERMIDVGRPQLDQPRTFPEEWTHYLQHTSEAGSGENAPIDGSAARAVFWAPTWEGDSPSMAYGTLPTSGPILTDALTAAGVRILYRPHPRTGYLDRRFREADRRVRSVVEAAGGFVDTTPEVSWQFDAADACIAEMSSVAFDWLATTKPLALMLPTDTRAEIVRGGLFERVPTYRPTAAAAVPDAFLSAGSSGRETGGEQDMAAIAQHYLGDVRPGAQISRFVGAVATILRERDTALTRRRDEDEQAAK